MTIRVRSIAVVCGGYLAVTMAQAHTVKNSVSVPMNDVLVDAIKSTTATPAGVIDQDLMNLVGQLMYGKTAGEVIDQLVYTYGNGEQTTVALVNIAQLLSQQLGYLSMAIQSAQIIISVLPPTSPHVMAAKLVINEMSALSACVQTILVEIQQNASTTPSATSAAAAPVLNAAPVASASTSTALVTPATQTAPAPVAAAAANAAPGSDAALASAAITLLGDVVSDMAASSNAPSSSTTAASSASATTGTSTSTVASSTNTTTHHHSGW